MSTSPTSPTIWQLVGSFAAIWDDILSPLPDEVWRGNLAIVRQVLTS